MSNETYSMDDQVIGFIYMTLSVVSIAIYIPPLIVIRTDPELRAHSCLRIMFSLGLSDLLHLFGEAVCGFLSLTGTAYTIPVWLNNLVINLTAFFGWNSYIILLNVLAFNRFVVISCSSFWEATLFSPRATTLWLIVCWFWACGWLVFNLSPWGGMIYHATLWVWYFDFTAPLVQYNIWAVFINCVVHQSCVWVWCVLACIGVRKQGEGSTNQRNREKERSLLVQSVLICVTLFIMDQYWHNFQDWFCPHTFLYCGPIGTFLLIFNNAINPIIYLTLNKTIKKKVLRMVLFKNRVASTTVGTGVPKSLWFTKRIRHESNIAALAVL